MASNISQFVGGAGPVAAVVNYFSAGSVNSGAALTSSGATNTKELLSGNPGAGVLSAALVNVSGRGRLNLCSAYTIDATPRTVRLQITVDGVVVFDATSDAISNTGYGLVGVGNVNTSTGTQAYQPIDFATSLVIKCATSLAENNKVAIGVNYETWS